MQIPDLIESRSYWRCRQRRALPDWRKVCAGVIFVAAFSSIAQDGRPGAPSGTAATATNGALQTEAGAIASQEKAVAADSQRKKQISDESTQLLAMAVALKAEVDKTNKDTLSLSVIRKADEIERLAHTVKARTKTVPGPG